MSSLRDLVLGRRAREERLLEPNRKIIAAELIRVGGSVAVTGKPGWVWIRTLTEPANVAIAFNAEVSERAGLPVLVAPFPKEPRAYKIISPDWSKIIDLQGYSGDPFLAGHHVSHESPNFKPGPDVVNVYPRALTELKTYAGSGGLTICVSRLLYFSPSGDAVEFGGMTNEDISAYKPAAGLARWLLVYLELGTNTIQFVAGNTTVDAGAAIPPYPVIPPNSIPSAFIKLNNTVTAVTEAIIRDARIVLGDTTATPTMNAIAALDLEFEMVTTEILTHILPRFVRNEVAILEMEMDLALTRHVTGQT